MESKETGIHILIIGQSCSGKTSLAKKMAQEFFKQGYKIAILEPIIVDWGISEKNISLHTSDPEKMLWFVKHNKNHKIFIDESEEMLKRDKRFNFFATRSRQYGHQVCFIGPEFTMILPAVRNQCTCVAAFKQCLDASIMLSRKYSDDGFMQCATLEKGTCVYKKTSFSQAKKVKIF